MKTESLLSQKYPRHLVLRLTLKSSMSIDYCWLRNRLRKLGPWDPKIIQEAQFYGWRDTFCAHRLLLTEKLLMKTESLLSQKSSSKHCSMADAEIFNVHRLLLAQKPFTKTRTLGPKNHPRSPVQQLTLTSSAHIDYCFLRNRWWKLCHCCHKNILDT